jgi:hypothetical protein
MGNVMMSMHRILPLLALLAAPMTLLAQRRPGAPASSTLGSVRGVVYDSLAGKPLEGARVWIVGSTGVGVETDAAGRFRIDSVPPGRAVIAFEHNDLDSIGLSNNARRITVLSGQPTAVALEVPSLATMYRAACGAGTEVRNARDSGVVFGTVEDVGTRARLAGARVAVSWVAARIGSARGVEVTRPGMTVSTDSVGNFYACGVPKEYVIVMTAQAGRFTSGASEVLLGERGIARRDLGVSRDSTAMTVDTVSGTRAGRATIIGTVVDEQGNPRPGIRASVDDAPGEAYSNESGIFVLRNLPAGSQTVMARMVGYSASRLPVLLRNDDTLRVRMTVKALTVLDTIRVTSRSTNSTFDLDELEHRLRTGNAFVLRGEDVRTRPNMRSVLTGLPSVTLEGRSNFNFTMQTLVSGRYHPVYIWIDGLPGSTESIQSYRPDQIIAVEWYPRGDSAPLRYQPSSIKGGVLLVWTRFIR